MQTGFLDRKLLQGIRFCCPGNVLEGADMAQCGLLAIIGVGGTGTGGAIREMHELADLFFQRHLAE